MKILEVVQSLAPGGAERLVVDLCNEMSKTEEVILLLLKDADHFYLPQVSDRVKVIQANMKIGASFKQEIQAIHYIRKISPDIIHYHTQARFTILLANIVLGFKYKFFMTIHNDVYSGYKVGVSGLQVKLAGRLGRTRFITISETNSNQFKEVYPAFEEVMIPNGRALPILSDKQKDVFKEISSFKKDEGTIMFAHIARCQPQKNQELLIDTFNELVNKGFNVGLIIIGNGFDSEHGRYLKNKSCNRIHYLGTKTNVYDYMSCVDAFCLSSLYEGMPITVIEAILSGLPILSTPVCGVVDSVIDGVNGYISKDFTKDEYYKIIEQFIQNRLIIKTNAMNQSKSSPYNISLCSEMYLKWFTK